MDVHSGQFKGFTRITLKIIGVSLTMSSVLYALVLVFLRLTMTSPSTLNARNALLPYGCALVIVGIAASFMIKEFFWKRGRAVMKTPDQLYKTLIVMTIFAIALAEVVDIVALVLYILGGSFNVSVALLVLAFLVKLVHFPREAEVARRKQMVGMI